MSGYLFLLSCFEEMSELNANSVDPDQTPRYAASDLGLHCLLMSLLWDAGLKWFKWDAIVLMFECDTKLRVYLAVKNASEYTSTFGQNDMLNIRQLWRSILSDFTAMICKTQHPVTPEQAIRKQTAPISRAKSTVLTREGRQPHE